MQEELHQFKRSKVWHLVPRPENRSIIGTKWVFQNKFDEFRTVTRNKARLWFKDTAKKRELTNPLVLKTMQVSWLIEKAPQVWLIILDPVWYLG